MSSDLGGAWLRWRLIDSDLDEFTDSEFRAAIKILGLVRNGGVACSQSGLSKKIGMSRSVVVRTIAKLKKAGIISIGGYKNIIVSPVFSAEHYYDYGKFKSNMAFYTRVRDDDAECESGAGEQDSLIQEGGAEGDGSDV